MNILYEIVCKNVHTFMKKNIWTPRVFNFFTFFERILYKSNCIIFIFSWWATHTKIRSKLVVIVTAGSQKTTLWGPQRTPLGILRVKLKTTTTFILLSAGISLFLHQLHILFCHEHNSLSCNLSTYCNRMMQALYQLFQARALISLWLESIAMLAEKCHWQSRKWHTWTSTVYQSWDLLTQYLETLL